MKSRSLPILLKKLIRSCFNVLVNANSKTKVAILVLMSSIFMVLISGSSTSIIYNIKPVCQPEPCYVNQTAMWLLNVSNEGVREIEVTKVELIDYFTLLSFASYNYDGLPSVIYKDAPGGKRILPGKYVAFNITGQLPSPRDDRRITYYPCFDIAIKYNDIYYQSREQYNLRYCSKVNESIYVVECLSSTSCTSNETCIANNCVGLECSECQYAFNHTCVNYECCSSEQCSLDSYCLVNKCEKLVCEDYESYKNHECARLDCRQDQYILNHTCFDLVCEDDEAAINHSCQKLKCGYDEYLVPHMCLKLNCSKAQGYLNNTCVDLACNSDEKYFNHSCRKLECFFFQDPIDHECINNRNNIIKFTIEAFIVIVLVLMVVLDVFKLGKKLHR